MSKQFSEEELLHHRGWTSDHKIYISVRGIVYDMSSAREFYGPDGPYHVFTGRECARALALLSLKPEDCTGNLDGLSDKQLATLSDWEDKFATKYPKIGTLTST